MSAHSVATREQLAGIQKLSADGIWQRALCAWPRLDLSFVDEGLPWGGRVVGVRTTLWWIVGYGSEARRLLERTHRDPVSR